MGQYDGAKMCFTENCTLVGNPMSDPQNWNLNNGLLQLTNAVQSDMAQIQDLLQAILFEIRRR